jgi:hypothetical protein
MVTAILFVAMQALGFGLRAHRRTQNNPPEPILHAPAPRRKPAPFTPEEDAEEDEGRRVSLEALEEDVPLTPCAFQTARFMRSSNHRPHHFTPHHFTKYIPCEHVDFVRYISLRVLRIFDF